MSNINFDFKTLTKIISNCFIIYSIARVEQSIYVY